MQTFSGTDFHDEHILANAPTNSLLQKLSQKSHYVIGLENNEKMISQINEQGATIFYFLARDLALLRLIYLLTLFRTDNDVVVFSAPKQYHEWITVFYFRRKLDEARKRFIRLWYC